MRVLIVDDDVSVRRLLRRHVESIGGFVMEAGSAEEAAAAVETFGTPEVAVCDVHLPGKSGLWLATELRTRYPDVAVVVTTGSQEFDTAVSSLRSGVVEYLVKPFTRDRLIAVLDNALDVHAARRARTAVERELLERRTQLAAVVAELERSTAAIATVTTVLNAQEMRAIDDVRCA